MFKKNVAGISLYGTLGCGTSEMMLVHNKVI